MPHTDWCDIVLIHHLRYLEPLSTSLYFVLKEGRSKAYQRVTVAMMATAGSLKGQHIIVTGSNSGIGRCASETARHVIREPQQ